MAEEDAVKYDVGQYQTARQLVRDARNDINQLPSNIKKQILPIADQIAKGVYESCMAIYEPETNPKKTIASGSDSDFKTDKKALEDFQNFFACEQSD